MPHYILSAIDPIHGRRVTEHVEAASGDNAYQRLVTRGLTDVVLHSDEAVAVLPTIDWDSPDWTPADRLVLVRGSRLQFTVMCLRKALVKDRVLFFIAFLLLVGAAVLRVVSFRYLAWGMWDTLFCVAVVALLIWTVARFYFFGRSRPLEKLKKLLTWARWREALDLLPKLPPAVSPFHLAYFKARPLAGLDRLPEALQTMQPFADGKVVPEWLYWSLVAVLYGTANDRGKMLAVKEQALALFPQNPSLLLTAAGLLLEHGTEGERDVVRARELTATAKTHVISDTVRYSLSLVDGLLALADNQPEQGRRHLEQGLADLAPHRNQAICQMLDAELRAHLAVALARCGRPAAALKEFRRAEPMLRAHREDELLQKCAHELGLAPPG